MKGQMEIQLRIAWHLNYSLQISNLRYRCSTQRKIQIHFLPKFSASNHSQRRISSEEEELTQWEWLWSRQALCCDYTHKLVPIRSRGEMEPKVWLVSLCIWLCVFQTVRTWRSPPRWTSSRSPYWRPWRSMWGNDGPASRTCFPKPWWRLQTCAASALKVRGTVHHNWVFS